MSSFQAIFAPRSMQQRRVPGPCQSIPTAYGESGAVFPKKKEKKWENSGGAVVRFSILGFKTSNISIQILLSLQTLSPLYFLAPREVGLNISFPPYN